MSARPALEAALWVREGRQEGVEIRFLCPAHDDQHPSARWHPSKATWFCDVCGVGGGYADLARRLGLPPEQQEGDLSPLELAEAKRLPIEFLRSLGVSSGVNGAQRSGCVDIPYMNPAGDVTAMRKRVSLTGNPRFLWRRGDKPTPYGLWRLGDAQRDVLVFVEGESDCWTLWFAGFSALGIPGAGTWREAWKTYASAFDVVYVWRENDQGGDTLVPKIVADLPDIRVIDAPTGCKDPNALWIACDQDKELFCARMAELMAGARPACDLRAEALSGEATTYFNSSRHLLEDPALLSRAGEAIRVGGYAGDLTAPLLVYIALISNLLERPMNLHLLGQICLGEE